jgi:hypothetical protein
VPGLELILYVAIKVSGFGGQQITEPCILASVGHAIVGAPLFERINEFPKGPPMQMLPITAFIRPHVEIALERCQAVG